MTIYTIGYAGFTVDEFADALISRGVFAVIDVRSTPFSEYHTEYNSPDICAFLKRKKILYFSFAKEFGARQENIKYYQLGYMDFEEFARSKVFRNGVKEVFEYMKAGCIFALMCAEKEPVNCHRSILAGRAFYELGAEVIHILPDGEITQKDLERDLLDMYFPDRRQGNLFTGYRSDEELIIEAYRLQNEKIGWRLSTE